MELRVVERRGGGRWSRCGPLTIAEPAERVAWAALPPVRAVRPRRLIAALFRASASRLLLLSLLPCSRLLHF